MRVAGRFDNYVIQLLIRKWHVRHKLFVSRRLDASGRRLVRVVKICKAGIQQACYFREVSNDFENRLARKRFLTKAHLDVVKHSRMVRIGFVDDFTQCFVRCAKTVTKVLCEEPTHIRIRSLLYSEGFSAPIRGEERIIRQCIN